MWCTRPQILSPQAYNENEWLVLSWVLASLLFPSPFDYIHVPLSAGSPLLHFCYYSQHHHYCYCNHHHHISFWCRRKTRRRDWLRSAYRFLIHAYRHAETMIRSSICILMQIAYESSTSISLPFIVNIIVIFLCLDSPYWYKRTLVKYGYIGFEMCEHWKNSKGPFRAICLDLLYVFIYSISIFILYLIFLSYCSLYIAICWWIIALVRHLTHFWNYNSY